MNSITKFGTKGFLCAIVAAQVAFAPNLFADEDLDRAKVETKKSARAFKTDAKKVGRKATGQDNKWDDAKDEASEAKENVKDEVDYKAKQLKK